MEKPHHVILVGAGARLFALEQGCLAEDLLVEDSRREWQERLKDAEYKPVANIENHDAVGRTPSTYLTDRLLAQRRDLPQHTTNR